LSTAVYFADTEPLKDSGTYSRCYDALPDFRKEKADAFVFDKDRYLSVGVWMLLQRALDDIGIDMDSLRFDRTGTGKPFIADSDIRFNLSHSHERVMCIVSDREVGCDVERIDPIDMNVAKRFFYGSEYDTIMAGQTPSDRYDMFYRFWTLKESFMKATGLGFRLPLDAFRIDIGSTIGVEQKVDGSEYGFAEYDIGDGYRYAACCRDGDIAEKMIRVDLR